MVEAHACDAVAAHPNSAKPSYFRFYFHCTKALRRSALWDARSQVPRSAFPSMGEVYREQLQLELAAAEIDAGLEKNAREHLY